MRLTPVTHMLRAKSFGYQGRSSSSTKSQSAPSHRDVQHVSSDVLVPVAWWQLIFEIKDRPRRVLRLTRDRATEALNALFDPHMARLKCYR